MRNLISLWKEKNKILEGIQNKLFKKEHVEQIAAYRQDICSRCVYIDKEGSACIMPGSQPCCKECGCSLQLKTRSLSSECPRKYWPAELSQQEADALDRQINQDQL